MPLPLLLPQRWQPKSLSGSFKRGVEATFFPSCKWGGYLPPTERQKVSKELMRNPGTIEMPLLNAVPLGNINFILAIHAANASSQRIFCFPFLLLLFEFESWEIEYQNTKAWCSEVIFLIRLYAPGYS